MQDACSAFKFVRRLPPSYQNAGGFWQNEAKFTNAFKDRCIANAQHLKRRPDRLPIVVGG
jgi:hypothetical protein